MNLIWKVLLGLGFCTLAVSGCKAEVENELGFQTEEINEGETAVPLATIIEEPILEVVTRTPQASEITEEEAVATKPSNRGTTTPGSALWIAKAREDLAKQQNVAIDQVKLITYENKVWPDSSLGCPQPGMFYKQVLSEGYFIQLQIGNELFNYHGGSGREPFLCSNENEK